MYSSLPSFVLGFHGCDHEVAEKIFAGKERLKPSENNYDWLGHGIYFWENNPARALEYARSIRSRPRSASRIRKEAVVGAIIDLGNCLNLLESGALQLLRDNFHMLEEIHRKAGVPLPENRTAKTGRDLLIRKLDCAVIEATHQYRRDNDQTPYDSVRGAFWEGEDLYPGAGFKEKNHIQICVTNPNCIKGYFRPLQPVDTHPVP